MEPETSILEKLNESITARPSQKQNKDPKYLEADVLTEFQIGAEVIYGFHGKCQIKSIELRRIGKENLSFYRLEQRKNHFTKSTKSEAAIWVPIASAKEKGLRLPMTKSDVSDVYSVLGSAENYFDTDLPWLSLQLQLESAVRTIGFIGLARTLCTLTLLKKRQLVPPMEITKFYATCSRLLVRELSDSSREPIKLIEEKLARSLKIKPITNH